MLNRQTKIFFGIVVWILLIGGIFPFKSWVASKYHTWEQENSIENQGEWLKQRVDELNYLTSPFDIQIEFDDYVDLNPGDKLYLEQKNGENRQAIGVVYSTGWFPPKTTEKYMVYARIYEDHIDSIGGDCQFLLDGEPGGPAWVIEQLLPDARRKELMIILRKYMKGHLEGVKNLLWPVLTDVAQESYKIIQKNIVVVFEKNKDRIIEKLKEVEDDYVDDEMRALWEDVILPIVIEKGQPVIAPIVEKIWSKLPKGTLVWLAIWQSLPGTDNDHVPKKLKKFVEEEALPILEEHRGELKELLIEVAKEIGKDEKVKEGFTKIFKEVFSDEELLKMLKQIFLEVYQTNKRAVTQKLKEKWEDPEFQNLVAGLTEDFEPYLIDMINYVLILEDGSLRAEFAKVLRRQVLYKDKYFLWVRPTKTKAPIADKFIGKYSWE